MGDRNGLSRSRSLAHADQRFAVRQRQRPAPALQGSAVRGADSIDARALSATRLRARAGARGEQPDGAAASYDRSARAAATLGRKDCDRRLWHRLFIAQLLEAVSA